MVAATLSGIWEVDKKECGMVCGMSCRQAYADWDIDGLLTAI